MGRATRWLKGLFGIKNSSKKDKCSIGQNDVLCHNPATIPPNISAAEFAWLRSCCDQTEKEQNKHAIAVAAATAAAADAAVAAAQAAVAVVRLTSHGRGTKFGGGQERWAAVKIQAVFRGYLARKALRALKGLVKLQAHVRGYLVRKQATATLHGMQALIRAQATVRSQRAQNNLMKSDNSNYNRFEIRARKSVDRFDETRSEHSASIHSRRLSASLEATTIEESPKIVEVDTGCRPKSRSRRTNTSVSDFNDDPFYQALPSPNLKRTPPRLSTPNSRNYQDSDWGFTGDECKFSTAQSTPRYATSGRVSYIAPSIPAESVCADNFLRQCGNMVPNYMANTKSFKAKVRSYSAPKQRPEPGPTKRLSLNEMMESRYSLSGVRMQRSCSQVQEAINFKNAVMGRLDRSTEFAREPERNW